MQNLVFVCTGNTCRSNVAEVLAVQASAQLGLMQWRFSSAGIMAFPGSPASENSLRAMQELGLDLSAHRATQLDTSLIEGADLILTMTQSHKTQILDSYPSVDSKVYTLLEYAYGQPGQVEDPFGRDIETYRRTSAQIKQAVYKVVEKLRDIEQV
ncbi:MAG TPA: low molecular weight protein arginine phosphatase [Candidatus Deferrimicrobium sp.]|nr:low molecular weight protein arginine phosphatase [Candidatus Deferrimicrobium sp.]